MFYAIIARAVLARALARLFTGSTLEESQSVGVTLFSGDSVHLQWVHTPSNPYSHPKTVSVDIKLVVVHLEQLAGHQGSRHTRCIDESEPEPLRPRTAV